MKFLTLYNRWMKTGKIPARGLCNSLPLEMTDTLNALEPTHQDYKVIAAGGFANGFWGSGLLLTDDLKRRQYEFTPLRQTIILLCAALNGEFDKPKTDKI